MFSIDVSPDMNMYTLLINQAYDPSFALCEFIDNAIHAHMQYEKLGTLEVNIDFFSNEYHDASVRNKIVITDNGPGIDKKTLETALKPASRPKVKGLSEFGIGMKAAAVWFTGEWELKTKPIGENKEYVCGFNLSDLLNNGSSTLTVFDYEANPELSGSTITLHNIRRDISEERYMEIINNIACIYQKFIYGKNSKVVIKSSYNGTTRTLSFSPFDSPTLVSPKHVPKAKKTYAIGEPRTWVVNIDFDYLGNKVKGFVEIKSVGSYPKNPGLVLLRNNRVICGLPNKKYLPTKLFKTSNKHRAMRVYGELELNGMPVSYTKDKFSFDDDDFCQALIDNNPGLSELLTQADNYRKEVITESTQMPPEFGGEINTNPCDDKTDVAPVNHVDGKIRDGNDLETDDCNSFDDEKNLGHGDGDKVGTHDQGENTTLSFRNETKIKSSQEIVNKLNLLGSRKFIQLYRSLCIISLEQHPAIMYVAAWAFFESLSKKAGSSTDFPAFLGAKMNALGYDREDKKSIALCLSDISNEGNCVKHDSGYVSTDAKKLAHYFEVTEKLIVDLLNEVIAKNKQ